MEGPGCPLDAGSTLQLSPTLSLVCISNSIAGFKNVSSFAKAFGVAAKKVCCLLQSQL